MLNRNGVFYLLITLISLYSCNNELIVDYELPNPVNKLVLQSTISPFTPPFLCTFKVKLWQSLPILDTTQSVQIKDAKVLWYEDGQFTDSLNFDEAIGGYTKKGFYFPEQGKEYKIVIYKEGFDSIFAKAEIPGKVSIMDASVVNLAGINNEGLPYSSASITFQDPESEQNFYEIIVTDTEDESSKFRLWTNEKIITEEAYYPSVLSFEKKHPFRLLFNDKEINGKRIKIVFYFVPGQVNDRGQLKIKYSLVNVYLRSVSEDYYKYYTTLLQHQYNQKGDFLYGLGEPLNVYTNIERGFGIFAGFQNEAVTCVIDSANVN